MAWIKNKLFQEGCIMSKSRMFFSAILFFSAFCWAQKFSATVDYDQPLEEMITAGNFNHVDHQLNPDDFSSQQKGRAKLNFYVIASKPGASTDEIIDKLDTRGLRPATLPELLAFGSKYPDEQRKYFIYALGSIIHRSAGDRSVAYIGDMGGARVLNLMFEMYNWFGDFRFLAVSKKAIADSLKVSANKKMSDVSASALNSGNKFTTVVDYGKSLEDMLAEGSYSNVDEFLNPKLFPMRGTGKAVVNFKVVDLGIDITTAFVLSSLNKKGLRPATLPELLAFGAKYPSERRKYGIIALGTVGVSAGGTKVVAFLLNDEVLLDGYDTFWTLNSRFLAVPK